MNKSKNRTSLNKQKTKTKNNDDLQLEKPFQPNEIKKNEKILIKNIEINNLLPTSSLDNSSLSEIFL